MDFWLVAAATGAGYVAKHWQNLSSETGSSSKLPPGSSPRAQSNQCQVFDKLPDSLFLLPNLAPRCLLDGDVSSPEKEHKVGMNFQDHNEVPLSGLAPIFIEKRLVQENSDEDGKHEAFDTSGHCLHEFRTKNTNGKSSLSVRPLVVTSTGRDSGRKQTPTKVDDVTDQKIVFMEENRASMAAAYSEPAGSVKLPRRPKQKYKRFETRDLHSQDNDMVLLFLGITIGILSTTVTNQGEVEHLNELLERADHMVQDLHNELERKERFTVKEHATSCPKAANFELNSEIEAELERLEENMKGCTLQKISNVMEIDSDFEADMARGDLNVDAVTWQRDSRQSNSDHCHKSESVGNPISTQNYAVSSLDLRLCLHEVIESDLRARIKELEAVLRSQNSPSKPHSPERQEAKSFWDFDHTRIESSSSIP